VKKILSSYFEQNIKKSEDPDLKQRAIFYYKLLSSGNLEQAKAIILSA
jgi:vesicle coat complex subunit